MYYYVGTIQFCTVRWDRGVGRGATHITRHIRDLCMLVYHYYAYIITKPVSNYQISQTKWKNTFRNSNSLRSVTIKFSVRSFATKCLQVRIKRCKTA